MAAALRVDLLLAAVVLVLTGPIVQVMQAHQASRYVFTAAIVDTGSVVVDDYAEFLGVDFAERPTTDADGVPCRSDSLAGRTCHLYSDKAPGQPFAAAPFYALWTALGGPTAAEGGPFDNLTLWWMSLWTAAVPAAVTAVAARHLNLRLGLPDPAATVGGLLVVTGTLLLPFAVVLFGHVLAGMLALLAYLLARRPDAPPGQLAAAGLLAGGAVLVEFTAGLVVVVLSVLVLARHRGKAALWVLGGLPAVAAVLAYNNAAFGGPLEFSYDHSGSFGQFHELGLFGVRPPSLELAAQVLLGERGLLTLTPIVALGLVGHVLLVRRGRSEAASIALPIFALYVTLMAGWFSATAGASPGPRYAVVALPFLAPGVAEAFRRAPLWTVLFGVLSTAAMVVAAYTNPLAQPTETFALGHWVWRVTTGRLNSSLLEPLLGDWALLVYLLVAAGLTVQLMRSTIASARRPTAPVVVYSRNSEGSVSSSSSSSGDRPPPSTTSTRA